MKDEGILRSVCFVPTIPIFHPPPQSPFTPELKRISMEKCETAHIRKKLCVGTIMTESVSTNYTLHRPKLQLETHCMVCQILTIFSFSIYAFSRWNLYVCDEQNWDQITTKVN